MAPNPVTVALVEDETEVLSRFTRVIGRNASIRVVHSCATARDMMWWIARNPVDVLLVDLGLPDHSGLEVIRLCRSLQPSCQIMVITIFGDPAHMVEAFQAGARGYIVKDGTEDELAEHVLYLHAGGSPMSPVIASQLLTLWQQAAPVPVPARKRPERTIESLTPREEEVLHMISRGLTYAETGKQLGITVATVQAHVRNIYGKLDVHNKAEALFEARQLGLLP